MEMVRDEMAADALDDEQFRLAPDNTARFLICLQQFISIKKYCILSLMLSLILTVQLLALFPPDLIKVSMAKGVLEMAHTLEAEEEERHHEGGNETARGQSFD
jgi:hypothetical protein